MDRVLQRRSASEGNQTENQDLLSLAGSSEKTKKEPLLQQLQGVCHSTQSPKDYGIRRSNISRPLSFSKRSLNVSRQSFASEQPESVSTKLPNMAISTHSLAYMSFGSLIYAALVFYILNIFLNMQDALTASTPLHGGKNNNNNNKNNHDNKNHSLGPSSSSFNSRDFKLCKTGVALSSYMLAACFCCFLICAMQNVFVSKIIKMQEGEERALKYLEECSVSRILAIAGFLSCVPVSFVEMAIFLSLRGSSTGDDNMVGVVFMSMGAGLCLLGGAHCCYHWREEEFRAHSGMPVYDSQFSVPANLASYASAPCHHLV